jgi:hypothetical protein
MDWEALCNKDMSSEKVKLSPDARAWYEKVEAQHIAKWHRSPLAIRMENRQKAARTRSIEILTPSDVIAERDLLVLMLMTSKGFESDYNQVPAIGSDIILGGLGITALMSEVFLWKDRTREAASAMKLPSHVFGAEGWPYPRMWWTFQNKIRTANKSVGLILDVQALVLIQRHDGVVMWSLCDHTAKVDAQEFTLEIGQDFLKFGQRIEVNPDDRWKDGPTEVIKMISFLNSKYIDSEPERLCRTDRKLCLHAGLPKEAERTVRVVDLRESSNASNKSETDDKNERDWAGRWWVRGHIRAQWCPRSQTHKLIYIAPYIKGPEDKPFLERMYRVVH